MEYKRFKELKELNKAPDSLLDFMTKRPKNAVELAKETGLRRPTVSGYLNNLYRRGLLEKVYFKKQIFYGLKGK